MSDPEDYLSKSQRSYNHQSNNFNSSGNHDKAGYLAPDFKRRQLIFDSFTRLQQQNNANSTNNAINLNTKAIAPGISSTASQNEKTRGTTILTWQII
jgi:hypothetical protein